MYLLQVQELMLQQSQHEQKVAQVEQELTLLQSQHEKKVAQVEHHWMNLLSDEKHLAQETRQEMLRAKGEQVTTLLFLTLSPNVSTSAYLMDTNTMHGSELQFTLLTYIVENCRFVEASTTVATVCSCTEDRLTPIRTCLWPPNSSFVGCAR